MSLLKYKYFAFISYRGADVKIAKRLQKKFYNFKLPPTYINPFNKYNKRMQPVCRDRDNFVGGEISAQIKDAIDKSMYVVMVCTPNMTRDDDKTNYVNDEICHLIKTGRINRLIPLVYEGRAYSPDDYKKANRQIENPFPDECLPYALRVWMKEHNNHDFTLNIFNIDEQGELDEEKMFLRCVATILAQEFSKLWDRFKIEQKKRRRNILISIISSILLFCFAIFAAITLTQPVDVKIKLNEVSKHNQYLPELENAVVSISVDDYNNSDTITGLEENALLRKVPYNFIGKEVRLTVNCDNWIPVDTIVKINKDMKVNIRRDENPYGEIQFRLWNSDKECVYPNVKVNINGHETNADSNGHISFFMPIACQRQYYIIKTPYALENDTLWMPTTESTVIEVK